MLLKNIDFLVTQDPERRVLEDADILIRGGKIEAVGRDIQAEVEEIDMSGKLVMPGLVNTHTHAPMTLLRGISDSKNLQSWLEEDIFPAEDRLEKEDAFVGSLLACMEMLETGTTCFSDMYFHVESIAEAVELTGMRAVIGYGMVDIDGDRTEELRAAESFVRNYQDSYLVTPSVAPHSVYTCSDELLERSREMADSYGIPYHIHVSETRRENLEFRVEKGGPTPVEYLYGEGLLDSDTILAHATWLSDGDRQLIADSGAGVAHNPAANLKLGSGIAEVPEMLEEDVPVGIGTDGVASNNSLNLFDEAKLASLLQKEKNPGRMTAQQVLDMATVGGAKVLGKEDEIGSVEPGKKADLVSVSLDHPEMVPFHGKEGLVSNLVFSFSGDVEDVFVDGERLVEAGNLEGIKRGRVMELAREKAEKLG